MPLIISRKVFSHRQIASNEDKVIAWGAIPAGGKFAGATVRGAIIGGEERSILSAMVYGMSGYVMPVLDINTLDTSPDVTWDNQVPKDDDMAEGALDYEVDALDTTPDIDVGPSNLSMLVGAKTGPAKLFRFERVVTFADAPTGFVQAVPDTYVPVARFGFRIKQEVRVEVPSVMLVAVSSPILAVPTSFSGAVSEWAPSASPSWMQLQYLGDALERTVPYLTGVVQAGAETPYVQAAELVARMAEQAYEDGAGAFLAQTMQSFSATRMTIEVPGWMRVGRISGG